MVRIAHSYRLPLSLSLPFPRTQQPLTRLLAIAEPQPPLSRSFLLTNPDKSSHRLRRHCKDATPAGIRSFTSQVNFSPSDPNPRRRPGPRIESKGWGSLGFGVTLATLAFAAHAVDPVEASTAAGDDVASQDDPLSKLNPFVLMGTTQHLKELPFDELVRLYFVYLVSSSSTLVSAGPAILSKLEWTRDNIPVIGNLIWETFAYSMKISFYHVFVGGASVPECERLVDKFASQGIGCLLIYSAEASMDGAGLQTGVNTAHIEEACRGIDAASTFPRTRNSRPVEPITTLKPSTFAIKLSGLVYDPQLLRRASSALQNSTSALRGTALSSSVLFPESPGLSTEDHEELKAFYEALRLIGKSAKDGKVRLFLDAEQSWYQPAIDRYADMLAEEFNKPDAGSSGPSIPVIYNTYQAYLRGTPEKVAAHMESAHRKGLSFGAKLVRGAYVEAERAKWLAEGKKGHCVVWDNKAESDASFDKSASVLEKRIADEVQGNFKDGQSRPGTAVCLATHNGTSVKKMLEAIETHGLAHRISEGLVLDKRLRGRVSFAQLLGMSDNLTSTITSIISPSEERADPTIVPWVLKYVTYASVDQALPYLIRRANENQSILQGDPSSGRGGATAERKAVGREMRQRIGLPW